jgi:hypothetical protein
MATGNEVERMYREFLGENVFVNVHVDDPE